MIDYLNGTLVSKALEGIIVDVNGVGYKISVPASTYSKLPHIDSNVKIYVVEAVSGMYGGVISLYGFLTSEERAMYLLIKDEVPGTGAKKAMEYTDKISKSFADFKTAIVSKNATMLNSIFGFTKKTSDKLIAALKDKISSVSVSGEEKWKNVGSDYSENTLVSQAISGLISLGYKVNQARDAVNKVFSDNENITLEELIKKSLQYL